MKNKLVIAALLVCLTFTGCGSSSKSAESGTVAGDASTESTIAEEEDDVEIVDKTIADAGIDTFISMEDYKGLDLEQTVTEVTDEDVENEITAELSYYPDVCPDGTAIEEGMTANIDYVGKIDGTEFDGGTATGYDLTIGSGTFIDGFEDQLMSHKKGDTVDVNVTFPDDYSNADLAGKDATFTVTVNEVKKTLDAPTDDWCAANTEYTTVDEYKTGLKESMEKSYKSSDESTFRQSVLEKLIEMSTFKALPKENYDKFYDMQVASLTEYAEAYGMEYNEDFLSQMGYTEDDIKNLAKSYAKIELVADYIMEKEGLTTDSDEYKDMETEILSDAGYETKQDALDDGISEDTLTMATKNYLAIQVAIDNANVTEVKKTVAEQNGTDSAE